MTEEQKQLLIKDLCGRLSYGVNVLHVKEGIIGVLSNINIYVEGREQKLKCVTSFYVEDNVPLEEFKPYLYPLSSMTEEQMKEYKRLFAFSGNPEGLAELVEWLNAHHFDYRFLIEQGLAINAAGVIMYREEKQP